MFKSKIGFGKCSSYFLFILGNDVFKCLRDYLLDFSPKKDTSLFIFKPVLANHNIITSLYMYLSYIIFGLIIIYISKYKIFRPKNKTGVRTFLLVPKFLIHNKNIKVVTCRRIFQIFMVSLIFVLHSDLLKLLYLFEIDAFDIWTFDVVFALLFMRRYFVINIYKHQKVAILLIITLSTLLLIISTFFPYSESPNEEDNLNSYQTIKNLTGNYFYCFVVFIGFILITAMTSFGRVLSKMLMDLKFISPYLIIFSTGIVGFFMNLISLIITTLSRCNSDNEYLLNKFCLVDYNDNFYYDNFYKYFSELKESANHKFYLEIFAITPLYLISNFLEFTCEIFTIYYLNPNYILIRDNLYYGASRLLLILCNINSFDERISLLQFIILELAEIFAIIGYLIYLEIIELRFSGLDENLKKNISMRAERDSLYQIETETSEEDDDDDDNDNDKGNDKNESNGNNESNNEDINKKGKADIIIEMQIKKE